MQRADTLEKTLMLGKMEGKKRRGWQRMRWLDSNINSIDMSWSKLQEIVKDREAWHAAVHDHKELDTTYQLNNNNIYMYNWFILLYSGNEHNIVNQLYSNKN